MLDRSMPDTNRSTHRDRLTAYVGIGLLAAVVIAFQLIGLGRTPLEAWDESRLAVNAVEMLHSGEWLVTTYGFHPDLWNTKPPLAINLMAWSMHLLGPTAFAVRLPAALASCTTIVLVAVFVRRATASLGCGIAAGVLLASGPTFTGYHSGRTGDYDAILTLFTTAYGCALFELIERERRAPLLALGTGGLVGLAILTKGIAGIIPGVGMGFFAVVFAFRALPTKLVDYVIVAATALAVGGVFYLLRNAVGDDYLAAVAYNELGGRFATTLEHHVGTRWFYLREFVNYLPGRLLPAVVALPLLAPGRPRRLAIFALCQIVGVVLVFSSAASKFSWYIVPALPFVAIVLALAGLGVARWVGRFPPWIAVGTRVALDVVLVLCIAGAIRQRYTHSYLPATRSRAFDALIAAAVEGKMVPLIVVDTGFPNAAGFVNYAPTLRFYALGAARNGIVVRQATALAGVGTAHSVGSCDPLTRDGVAAFGRPVWSGAGCILAAR